ncbi:MAG TPA: MATE family efflux transporter [Opitutaceae bacterium]|jgi:putative MATE family efflux protein
MAPSRANQLSLIGIAWPIFIEQTLRMLIGTVDTFMVSHVSDGAVAALGVANQVIIFFIVAFNFIGIGTSVVITHHLGARDRPGADKIATNAIAVNTWLGALFSACVYLFAFPMLRTMQLPASLMDYALPFLTLMGGTLFMESMNISIAAVLRAHGHTRDAMLITLGQNILNVIGNWIALFGLFGLPPMGVLGVALSGVVSRCAACLAFWILLDYHTHLRLRAADFVRISWSRVKRILHIGLPAAGEQICYWTAFLVVTTFVARLGSESLSIQSYTLQIQRFAMLFSFSIGLGTEILIGHHVGAGLFEEAYHRLLRSVKTGLLLASGVMVVIALLGPHLFGFFTQNAAIIAGGALLLRLAIVLEPGRVFNVVVISSLRATGDVGFPIQMAALSMWGVWVPLAWLLGLKLGLGLAGFWIAMITDEWLRGLLMYRRWKKRRWLKYAERSHARAKGAGDSLASA